MQTIDYWDRHHEAGTAITVGTEGRYVIEYVTDCQGFAGDGYCANGDDCAAVIDLTGVDDPTKHIESLHVGPQITVDTVGEARA